MKPVKRIDTNCRYCGAAIQAFEDDPTPSCPACNDIEQAALADSLEVEESLLPIVEPAFNAEE